MKNYQATWEDEETSRQVELVVNYQLDATRVDINHVTPTRVTFLCPKTKKPLRSIGVWTEKGRRILANQVAEAGRLATMAQEIAEGRLVEIRHAAQLPKSYTANPVLQA
jgi:hypothetical protein